IPAPARRMAVSSARRRRLQSRVRDRLRIRDARARDGRGTRLQPHSEYADRRVRPSRRSSLCDVAMKVTVVWATPSIQDMVPVELPTGATVADAVDQSGLLATYGLDPARLGLAVFGRRASRDTPLAEGDRVELTRSLEIDPKAARIARARAKPLPKAA